MHQVSCPKCRKLLLVRDDALGHDCRCPKCQRVFLPHEQLRVVDLAHHASIAARRAPSEAAPAGEGEPSDLARLVLRIRRLRRGAPLPPAPPARAVQPPGHAYRAGLPRPHGEG